MDTANSTAAKDTGSPVRHKAMTAQERDRLRRYIAVNVVGDSPPPLTSEARDLIRRILGPRPDQAEENCAA
jgi:hypothetical protein